MPTNTQKFNLIKPLKSEKYNVDVFNGNADIIDSQIYSKTEVDTALNGKANSVHNHPISEVVNLQTALNGKANSVHNHPISEVVNLQTSLNGKVDKLMATNLITNGDFSNGTTGFQVSPGATLTNVNNQGVVVFGETGRALELVTPILATISDKIYLKFNAMTSGITTLRIRPDATTLLADLSLTSTLTNYSYVTTTATNSLPLRFILLTGDVNASVTFDNILAINLTTLFGAGNEPTREQMDRLLSVYPNSWFNGTSEIGSIGALMRASLGGQVVTPTLLNSRTGTAQYVVSNDGLVIFRGTASGGSLNTNIFVLPDNIRPIATRTFPISANGAFGVITVAANGEVRQTAGALTNVFLDGIVFKVGV